MKHQRGATARYARTALAIAGFAAWVDGCGGKSRDLSDRSAPGGYAGSKAETGGSANRNGGGGDAESEAGADGLGNGGAGVAGFTFGSGGRSAGGSGNQAGETTNGGDTVGGAGVTNEAGRGGEMPSDALRHIVATDLNISLDTRTGIAILTLAASTSRGATFEIGDTTITSVTDDDGALGYTAHGATLDVDVPAASEELKITIEYRFKNHEAFDGISGRGYSFTWPYYCGNAFPCHSDPAEGTTFKLFVKGGPTFANFPNSIPFPAPAYMAAWASENYFPLFPGRTKAGTQIEVFYRLGNPTGEADARAGTAHLIQAFDWYERHLGPYKFGSTVGPIPVRWPAVTLDGMEHHPLWHVNETSMSDELVQVHEAAHGWFGNGVRLRCWEDFVLSEGTVSYLAARVLEEVGATTVSTAAWDGYESTFMDGQQSDSIAAWPSGCGSIDVVSSASFRA